VKDESVELIRHLAAECGVALDRSDPLVIAQTATLFIVRKALEASEKTMAETLTRHRQELEATAARWQADAKSAADSVTKEASAAIAAAVAREHGEAFRIASAHFVARLAAQNATLERARRSRARAALIIAASFGAIGFALPLLR
jgi:hypothetical protein